MPCKAIIDKSNAIRVHLKHYKTRAIYKDNAYLRWMCVKYDTPLCSFHSDFLPGV